jgi:hypothetical protein
MAEPHPASPLFERLVPSPRRHLTLDTTTQPITSCPLPFTTEKVMYNTTSRYSALRRSS